MSRQFGANPGNDEFITLAVGNAAAIDGGPISVIALIKPTGALGGIIIGLNGATDVWAVVWDNPTQTAYVRNDFTGGPTLVNDEWQIIGYDKDTGTGTVRWHHYPFESGSWSHTDGASVADGTGPIDSIRIGLAFNRTVGLVAAAAVWGSRLGDAGFEAAGATALADWMALSPAAAWRLNQAATTTPVVDLTGGGADETAVTLTAVSADDPPGWSYDTFSVVPLTVAAPLGAVAATATMTRTVTLTAAAPLGGVSASAALIRTVALTGDAPLGGLTAAAVLSARGAGAGGWYTLVSIGREMREIARQERSTPPSACPNDGEPLRTGPGGRLFCRFDGWEWDRTV